MTDETAIIPVPDALLGIDVSRWQKQIDWAKVSEAGVKFAFIKATDGLVADPMAKTNCDGAAAAGVPFGLYHFWRPTDEAAAQATNFLNVMAALPPTNLFALDIETGGLPEEKQAQALAWLAEVAPAPTGTRRTLVYVSPSYAQINLTDPAWLEYPLWVAHYTENPKPNTVKWPTWMFWQRQANAVVPGVPGVVDIDWYNGSLEDFQKLIQLPT